MLQLTLLGPPHIQLGDAAPRLRSRKAQALLFVLASADRTWSRGALVGLLWGGSPEAAARRSLRVALTKLRAAVGEYVQADGDYLRLNRTLPHWIDVAEVTTACAGLPAGIAAAETAVPLLRGDFLEDFQVRDAPEFETWLLGERENQARCARRLLDAVTAAAAERGRLEEALAYARRLLALDPWREDAQRRVIRLLARLGRTGEALAQYELCRELLARELGVQPTPETETLIDAVRAGDLLPAAAQELPPAVPHNLPADTTRFIGRAVELDQIADLLAQPDCRMVTLLGPGGVGKTRLALEAARRRRSADDGRFRDGIFFVPLAAAAGPEDAVLAIAAVLQLPLSDGGAPLAQLHRYLAERRLLLVLDNCEQLADTAGWLADLLAAAPDLVLLVTSQKRLPLPAAWNLDLHGLALPAGESDTAATAESDAVALFVDRARRLTLQFDPSREAEHVLQVCRLVDGLPLAIELAAGWVRAFTCAEIAGRIGADLNFLATSAPGVPARQRSVRAVFTNTLTLLSAGEQRAFAAFSVFRGGFDADAAAAVVAADRRLLLNLVDKSLLRRDVTGRYEIHELLRQLAAEQLTPYQALDLQEQHAAFYCTFLQQRADFARQPDAQQTVQALERERHNLRLAWASAVDRGSTQLLIGAAPALSAYYEMRGYFGEGASAFAAAADSVPSGTEEQARLLLQQARFAFRLGQNERARDQARAALRMLEPAGARRAAANALLILGNAVRDLGDHAAARDHFRRSAGLFEELNDLSGLAAAANNLGVVLYYEDDLPGATAQFQAALDARLRAGIEDVTLELGNVGLCYGEMGDYPSAIIYLRRSLDLARRLGAPLAEGLAHHNLGNAYRNNGDLAEAGEHLGTGITIFRELGSRDALAAALADLAAAHIAGEAYDAAEAALQEGLTLEKALARPRGIAFKELGLGNLRVAQGRLADARRHYAAVLAQPETEIGSAPILNALLGAAVVAARRGDDGLLPVVLATVHGHPQAGQETRANAAAWGAKLGVTIDPAAARPPDGMAPLIAALTA